ncbi:TetR/AcrR family transcriptional regulator [Methylobacterium sp. WL64]|uniref:TetR/AcrR family transcriptional regulator n=1 Tax=Methylobacterium sp. WL64 TaxID=2603894 RepID=UPI0011CBC965|nr:TetR/AcrR family transcriptional regulator [Methylobacterium sp. WL64]TXN00743.1 TetR/AcrR family transcriptional regulator [Methylobacterium sp. WL64]
MRKDAERNRDKLITAASEIMRTEGGDVPMEMFAERANLTRATLYRNFPHRQAMYEAVLERDLDALRHRIAGHSAGDPLAFIRFTTELMAVYDKFLARLVEMPDYDADTNQARMRDVLAAPLAAAQAAGLLRPELTAEAVLTACRMLASLWKLDDEPDFDRSYERRLAILLDGIGSPSPLNREGAQPKRRAAARSGDLRTNLERTETSS